MRKILFIVSILVCMLFLCICLVIAKPVRVEVPCRADVIVKAEEIRKAQIGVKELTGNNDGWSVRLYQISVGLPVGSAYCAAGQYYCFQEAVHQLGLPSSEIPIKRTGLANGILSDAKKRGVLTEYRVKVYDLIVWIKQIGINGHIESISKILTAGWVETIGFNTSSGISGSQNDGQGVYKRKRNIYHPLAAMVVSGLVGFKSK